ncbi:regulatory protein GemA [Photobacterium damselae subsp. damselae]|uniref:regulatory protein GemA n=1 Tax=Photobacterium damselae TaxID=38293 RepID=UPI00311AFB60
MKINRNVYYGLVHKGIKACLEQRMGFYDEDEYRNQLALRTNKTSCKDLTNTELHQLVKSLERDGHLTLKGTKPSNGRYIPRPGGNHSNKPSDAQWAKLAALAKDRGWSGLDAIELARFVKRTVKVEQVSWLTAKSISLVILGLERWNAQGG